MKNRMVNLSDTYQGQDRGRETGCFVHETPHSDACADERSEFDTTDASAAVLHYTDTLLSIFFEHSNYEKKKKKIPHAAHEATLAPTEEGINSSRSSYRCEL